MLDNLNISEMSEKLASMKNDFRIVNDILKPNDRIVMTGRKFVNEICFFISLVAFALLIFYLIFSTEYSVTAAQLYFMFFVPLFLFRGIALYFLDKKITFLSAKPFWYASMDDRNLNDSEIKMLSLLDAKFLEDMLNEKSEPLMLRDLIEIYLKLKKEVNFLEQKEALLKQVSIIKQESV